MSRSRKIASPQQIKKELSKNKSQLLENLDDFPSLQRLQEYMRQVVIQRGFDQETPTDVMLLMVEEVGELAKALRKYVGLKIDQNKQDKYTHLEHELADVLIYLLDLANICQIDLFQAFKEKERENNKRFWDKAK